MSLTPPYWQGSRKVTRKTYWSLGITIPGIPGSQEYHKVMCVSNCWTVEGGAGTWDWNVGLDRAAINASFRSYDYFSLRCFTKLAP